MNRQFPLALALTALLAAAACKSGNDGHERQDGDHKGGEHNEHDHGAGDHEGGEEGVVHVTKEAVTKNDIRVEKATAGRLAGGVDAPAEVTFQPDKVAHVTLLVPGRITSVSANLGDKVKQGSTLATVDSAELSEAQGASAQAQAALDVARKGFDRQKELQAAGIGAQRNYDEAEAQLRRAEADASAAAQRTRVYGGGGGGSSVVVKAPIDGEVVERHATIGEVVDPNEPLFVIADLSAVAIEGRIYEKDVASVDVGATAKLTLQAHPGKSWQGTLDYVSPHLDEKTRTTSVRMMLDNKERKLKPGLFGTITVLGKDDAPARTLVPASAVQRMKAGDVVFVPAAEEGPPGTSFKVLPVAVGAKREGMAEIVSGLMPGDAVVVSGAFVLKSEVMKSELGEGHAH